MPNGLEKESSEKKIRMGFKIGPGGKSLRIFVPVPSTAHMVAFQPLDAVIRDLTSDFGKTIRVTPTTITISHSEEDSHGQEVPIDNHVYRYSDPETKQPLIMERALIRLGDGNPPQESFAKVVYLRIDKAQIICTQEDYGTEISITGEGCDETPNLNNVFSSEVGDIAEQAKRRAAESTKRYTQTKG